MESGIFITFEGCEACGKSTQISKLADRLEASGREVVVTREPGGTDIGEEVRSILTSASKYNKMCPEAELLLFSASRAQLVREVIAPAIRKGKIVLCDRFFDSTTVYQGVARKLNSDDVKYLTNFAVGEFIPNLTFLLDIPSELSVERVKVRNKSNLDRFEMEPISFYNAVREGYLDLAQMNKERFCKLDGTQSIEDIAEQIWQEVSGRFFDNGHKDLS